jgi:molybdopterin-containing oxidoreductase family membrane subunit
MGLIVPAFVPTPLGEVVEYVPTLHEILVCLGIWAFGLLMYTIFVRVSVPVLAGEVTHERQHIDNRDERCESPASRNPVPE